MSLTNSVAGGSSATVDVNHNGCFVWSDSTGVLESTTAVDQFRIRAAGGTFVNSIPESDTVFDKVAWDVATKQLVLNPTVAISVYNSTNAGGTIPLTTVTSSPGNPKTIRLDSTLYTSDSGSNEDFTFSGNAITVTRAGVYDISFQAAYQSTNAANSRTILQTFVTLNGTTFAQAITALWAFGYHRGYVFTDAVSSSGRGIVQLAAGSVLRLIVREYYTETASGGNILQDLANSCMLTVKRI